MHGHVVIKVNLALFSLAYVDKHGFKNYSPQQRTFMNFWKPVGSGSAGRTLPGSAWGPPTLVWGAILGGRFWLLFWN